VKDILLVPYSQYTVFTQFNDCQGKLRLALLLKHALAKPPLHVLLNPNYGKGRSNRPITGSRIVQADLVGPIEIPLI
jgi:hypothetical protein